MKTLALRAVALALISCLILVWAPQAAAQANTTPAPVRVVNTTKNPVPTADRGTTKISANVNVTNASLPVNGNICVDDALAELRHIKECPRGGRSRNQVRAVLSAVR
jgi:hypothetical protein